MVVCSLGGREGETETEGERENREIETDIDGWVGGSNKILIVKMQYKVCPSFFLFEHMWSST